MADTAASMASIRLLGREMHGWTRFLCGVDWDDPANCDIILNREHLGTEGACDLSVRMAGLEQFRGTSASRGSMEDLTLCSPAVAALASDERTADAEPRVQLRQGVVAVGGFVQQGDVMASVPEMLNRVEGIVKLVNDVAYTPPWPM